ncbi:MAG TPA: dephospho-CoA kinase [Candidatus Binatia bacterium]|nr:dephospho-CoA kinase [Candidatus Binatia bacterium]
MIILGLTGSIGMGKSTAATVLSQMGIAVHDADRNVHRLMAKGGAAVERIAAAFPGVVKDGAVDRGALGKRVFGDTAALNRLEAILHPMVQAAERAFLAEARRRRCPVVVLDIPLLYETRGENRCDAVIVVTAPQFIQSLRVLRRKGMTPERLKDIVMRQMPDAEKRKRADFVVPTGLGKRQSRTALLHVVKKLKHR